MRFTKFLAATMAAMTIVSCSEQVEDFGANVQPGDAVLSFKVGTNGGTTYASSEDESKVNTLIGFLAYTDENGAAAFMEINGSAAGLNTTIPDGKYTAGPATMYFVANMPAVAGVADEAALTAFTDTKTIYTNVGGALTLDATGMSATRKVAISLKSGQVTDGTLEDGTTVTDGKIALKRLAARVYAVSGNTGASDITGYKVDFAGTKANSTLFGHVGGGTGIAPATYSITGTGTGQYGGFEAVGYVYPSADDVTINVTNTLNVVKSVTFKPVANNNYKLIITPSKDGANLSFTVSVAEYGDGDDLNVDFNGGKAVNSDAIKAVAGLELTSTNNIAVQPMGVGTASTYLDVADLLGAGVVLTGVAIESEPKTLADIDTDFGNVSANKRLKFRVVGTTAALSFMPNNTDTPLTYKLKFSYSNAGVTESTIVTFTQAPLYPAGFSVKMGTEEWMVLNTQNTGKAEDDINMFNEINGKPGLTFYDKALAFTIGSNDNLIKIAGGFAKLEGSYGGVAYKNPTCPPGYAVPSSALLRNEFFGVSGTWPGSGNEAVLATDYPLATEITGTTPTTKKVVKHKLTYQQTASKHGYITIVDVPTGNKALMHWKGSRDAGNNLGVTHISSVATLIGQGATSAERFNIGALPTGQCVFDNTSYVVNATLYSLLVRCVKQTPNTYWTK